MKKLLCAALLAACFCVGSYSYADGFRDYEFNQDRMVVSKNRVYLMSSFEEKDFISCYDLYGNRLFNIPFHAKIISWRMVGDMLVVFSKDRKGSTTYITSIDSLSGTLLWQRP